MKIIATCAHYTGARCQFGCKRLTAASTLGYHPPVSAKKALIGFGDPKHPYDASRRTPAVSAASLSVPPVMVARWEARKGLPVPARGVRFANPSSHRPRLAMGAVVFANHTPWRPHMAQIILSPYAGKSPVVQTRTRGRLPNAVGNLWRARMVKSQMARINSALKEEISQKLAAADEWQRVGNMLRYDAAALQSRLQRGEI